MDRPATTIQLIREVLLGEVEMLPESAQLGRGSEWSWLPAFRALDERFPK